MFRFHFTDNPLPASPSSARFHADNATGHLFFGYDGNSQHECCSRP